VCSVQDGGAVTDRRRATTMPEMTINGRSTHFTTVKPVLPSEVKATIKQAAQDGKDNVVYRQGRDTFIMSSPRNANLINVEPAFGLYGGSPASVAGKAVRLIAVSDEVLTPMQQSVKVAEKLDDENNVGLANKAYAKAVTQAHTLEDALSVAESADARNYIRVVEAAYGRAIDLADTVKEAQSVAAHAGRNGFIRRELEAKKKAVDLL
jgi:hypothetical protein